MLNLIMVSISSFDWSILDDFLWDIIDVTEFNRDSIDIRSNVVVKGRGREKIIKRFYYYKNKYNI
jgi:hypothetical protein